MFNLFPNLNIYIYAAIGALLIGLFGFYSYKVYSFGFQRAETAYILKINEIKDAGARETTRQNTVNAQALSTANEQLQTLQSENDQLNDQVEDDITQADKDPNAARVCLGLASVQRLNSIGGHSSRKASTASSAKHSKMR